MSKNLSVYLNVNNINVVLFLMKNRNITGLMTLIFNNSVTN